VVIADFAVEAVAVVAAAVVVVVGGQPSIEKPLAIVSPSGQQPNAVA